MYLTQIQNQEKVMWNYVTKGNNGKDEVCVVHREFLEQCDFL